MNSGFWWIRFVYRKAAALASSIHILPIFEISEP